MSAFGTETAVVSLGVSCQTAWQINKQVDLLSHLTGERLVASSAPFDWLIMPPRSFAGWMAAGGRFPEAPDEIVVHPNFYWPAHNLHFWHEFTQDGAVALDATFARTKAKFAHLLAKVEALRGYRRCLLFVSNTQSNLDEVTRVSPPMDFRFTAGAMAALVEAARVTFGEAAEVHFVARPDRVALADGHPFNLHLIGGEGPGGAADVLGDEAAWERVFRAAIRPGAGAHRRAA
ncbi:hypothetical protein OPKNFCMD_4368 [Methylobacterium crusticola]|uniref:Papain-like cysteine peptidase n=1 Tax=Methylobacterium crusticola TaxID=1697972 RepID=A0ABQ4R1X5_9HYPH|nr:hypothetical protein [Methylobacterium crusticola]GJD51613.1 hypothetical protein OPKNFCMD_4368 [Methylobacterium crusticola]